MVFYKSILFDLDGTLTDSSEGIINSIKYALGKMNFSEYDEAILKKFIGPPLMDSYKMYFGFSDEQAYEGLMFFREYFTEKGMFENRVYDGMEELLKRLCESGKELVLATSKPEFHARKILEHFGIMQYFKYAAGCPLEEKGITKIDVMRYALEHTTAKKSETVMVGDTHFDIEGADACGIDSIGVLYGMGEADEIKSATYLADSVEQLGEILLGREDLK